MEIPARQKVFIPFLEDTLIKLIEKTSACYALTFVFFGKEIV
jgi:hypothetical protein